MIPLAIPQMVGREAEYLQECVTTNFVSSVGPFVDRFETLCADVSGTAQAVATASGTAGLHAALAAVGVRRDDLVVAPSFTFIATANAIRYCGADPWMFDVEQASWTIDAEQLSNSLKTNAVRDGDRLIHRESGQRIAAIMPVYTLGMPASMDALSALAAEYGLPVVVDAAAALGATYEGRAIGELGADLSVFSFNGNKTVTAGGGGAVAGNDEALLQRVRHLTTTARRGPGYLHDEVGFNYRMTNLQSAVGCAQLEHLQELVERKRAIAERYAEAWADLEGVTGFASPADRQGACWFSGAYLDRWPVQAVGDLQERLRGDGIDARPFWMPIHLQPPYKDCIAEPMPVSEHLWERIVTLPCSTSLTDAEQDFVIDRFKAAVAESAPGI